MKKKIVENVSNFHLFDLMERIADAVKGQGTPKQAVNLPDIAPYTQELSARLDLTELQALLLSLFINCYPDSEIEIKDLAKHLSCANIAVLACNEDIKMLTSRHYLHEHKRANGSGIYYIPANTITAFRDNHDVEKTDYSNMDGESLFQEISQTLQAYFSSDIDDDELYETLNAIVSSNPQLTFCQKINEYRLSKEDWTLLVRVCCDFYYSRNAIIDTDDIRKMFPMRIGWRIIRTFSQGNHPLLRKDILEPAGGALATDQQWCLATKAAKELMGELCPNLTEGVKRGVINAETIGTKAMFYPAKTARQISELEDLLMPKKFQRVQKSLEKHGMRKGFACLFYGAPGTGKTETVLQVARKTGRDIMQVDMSQLRDKFVGESEKNVKQIFTTYRRLCQHCELTPILLLNEADALLSVRLTHMRDSVDQMANTMQNIILQEMETLDGILIATTNLTQNLDAAFDRRFLYKVEFEKPTAEESRHIWQAMLPSLSDEHARTLASKYDFSGGQIENIARKQLVSNILHDKEEVDLSAISKACDQEKLNRQGNERIRIAGFC